MSTEMNLRLLLKDDENVIVAVPLNDNLVVKSGIQRNSCPAGISDAIDKLNEPGNAEYVSTVVSQDGVYMVAKSVSEIFTAAAEARNSKALIADFTRFSGVKAIEAKAKSLKP